MRFTKYQFSAESEIAAALIALAVIAMTATGFVWVIVFLLKELF